MKIKFVDSRESARAKLAISGRPFVRTRFPLVLINTTIRLPKIPINITMQRGTAVTTTEAVVQTTMLIPLSLCLLLKQFCLCKQRISFTQEVQGLEEISKSSYVVRTPRWANLYMKYCRSPRRRTNHIKGSWM